MAISDFYKVKAKRTFNNTKVFRVKPKEFIFESIDKLKLDNFFSGITKRHIDIGVIGNSFILSDVQKVKIEYSECLILRVKADCTITVIQGEKAKDVPAKLTYTNNGKHKVKLEAKQ